jgi:hypothetical protein
MGVDTVTTVEPGRTSFGFGVFVFVDVLEFWSATDSVSVLFAFVWLFSDPNGGFCQALY